MASDSLLKFASAVFGWVYFLAWSASFYPQGILNWRRRSTSGTTVDFHFINSLGFLAYFISNVAFAYSSEIRRQYAARHHGLEPAVQLNDIVFALHGFILSVVTASQYMGHSLWGFPPTIGNRPSRFMLGIFAGCLTGVACTCLVVTSAIGNDPSTDWVALDIVYAIGYVKIVVTLIKYTPQILVNYRNKSTEGWSILQILLDVTGGVLSVSQLAIDSYLQGDWSGVTGNPVKLALGNISMVYDAIFIVQHYILYRGAHHKGEENERLLDDERRID